MRQDCSHYRHVICCAFRSAGIGIKNMNSAVNRLFNSSITHQKQQYLKKVIFHGSTFDT